jgi:MoaA/NifB/PqqE/SkfB family radical SAM enzyme
MLAEVKRAGGRALRRTRRRIAPRMKPREVPAQPTQAKFELTYHCNLRCGFCYTDSPRRTLERTPELDDGTWRRIIGEGIDLGINRAIITGGEPLLRRELALESAERLAGAGVAVTFNTNGWFVNAEVADRLAACQGLQAHISVDGPTPELHEAARGVPGSWRRAIEAIDLLLQRGANVRPLTVVTPDNQQAFGDFLDQMWTLGVRVISVTPVVPVGAAARSGDWGVDPRRIEAQVRAFQSRTGGRPKVLMHNSPSGRLSRPGYTPSGFMIRPNGGFLVSSNHPFSFGDAASEPLAHCWDALRVGWTDDRVRRWVNAVPHNRELPEMDLVPYRDEEVQIVSREGVQTKGAAPANGAKRDSETIERALDVLQAKSPAPPPDGIGDLEAARAKVLELALGRAYKRAPGDCAIEGNGDSTGKRRARTVRLNRTASMILRACESGTPGDAVNSLGERYPAVPRSDLEPAVLGAIRKLVDTSVLAPALTQDDSIVPVDDEELLTAPSDLES